MGFVRGATAGAGLVVAAVLLAGCSHEPATPAEAFDAQVSEAIELAKRADASAGQLAALETAKQQGSLSFEIAKERALAAVDCMTAAGVGAQYDERVDDSGQVVPVYLAQISPDSPVGDGGVSQDERIAEQCDSDEAFYVNKLYLTQPAAVEAREAELKKRAPEIRECLEDAGYSPPAEATPGELDDLAMKAYHDTEGGVNCMLGWGL